MRAAAVLRTLLYDITTLLFVIRTMLCVIRAARLVRTTFAAQFLFSFVFQCNSIEFNVGRENDEKK